VARTDVPTCERQETVGAVRDRIGDWPVAVVVEDGCVLGEVPADVLDGDPSVAVESVMRPGPSTFRPSVTREELAGYLEDKGQSRALLTTLHGRLVGIVGKDDLEGGGDE
jgi:CBS domain-containing protein